MSIKLKNPYNRSVFSVGYLCDGENRTKANGKLTEKYTKWYSMIRRCYSENYQKDKPSYIECTAIEEWHNFQNFCKWYDKNYY